MVVLLLIECCDIDCVLLEFDSYGIRAIGMAERLAEYAEILNVYSPCTAMKSIWKAGTNLTKLNISDQRRSIR